MRKVMVVMKDSLKGIEESGINSPSPGHLQDDTGALSKV